MPLSYSIIEGIMPTVESNGKKKKFAYTAKGKKAAKKYAKKTGSTVKSNKSKGRYA